MADEVPVCDVLCEAMEYLSKLGSNLRTRSENLKEKRIRKEKLKNYHAVQKAADKVLLICQLSKKSLENVESGVRKVLTLLNEGQSSLGVDAPTREKSAKYQYFRYRSHKLRILKKVPVKHYMSVKVMARRMLSSMQDKYPVYYDCKLYRRRKRKEKFSLSKENAEDDNKESRTLVEIEKTVKMLQNPEQNEEVVYSDTNDYGVEKDTSEISKNSVNSDIDKDQEKQQNSLNTDKGNKSEFDKKGKSKSDLKDLEFTSGSKGSFSRNKRQSSDSLKRSEDSDESSKQSESKDEKQSSESNGRSKDDDKSSKKIDFRNKRQSSDSSERIKNDKKITKKSEKRRLSCGKYEDETSKESELRNKSQSSKSCRRSKDSDEDSKRSESGAKKQSFETLRRSKDGDEKSGQQSESHSMSKDDDKTAKKTESKDKRQSLESRRISEDDSNDKSPRKSKKFSKTKFKNIRVIDDDSSENSNEPNSNDKSATFQMINQPIPTTERNDIEDSINSCENSDISQLHKKLSLSTSDTEDVQDNKNSEIITKTTSDNVEKLNNEPVKPIIKCVSLTKLLKPDILNKDETVQNKIPTTESSILSKNKVTNKEQLKQINKIEKYLTKLPSKSDEEFWVQKRKEVSAFIAKSFYISMTRLPELSQSFLKSHDLSKITLSERIICELTFEKQVTNEISSQKISDDHLKPSQNAKKSATSDNIKVVKSALLNDSDSEKSDFSNKSLSPMAEITETVKNALLDDSDVDKKSAEGNRCQNNSVGVDPDQIKNVLLNDSDSDKSEKNNEDTSNEKNSGKNKLKQDFSKIKKALLDESDSEKYGNSGSVIDNKDNSSINNENVSDQPNVHGQGESQVDKELDPPNKDKEQINDKLEIPHSIRKKNKEGKPKSKRKHIMESMHAKKMLLTYSSSSDTEDEQLRNALKEIKDSLLEGSDDEKKKEKKIISNHSSSDSENDILTKTKGKLRSKEECSTADSETEVSKQKSANKSNKSSRKRDGNSSDDSKPKKKVRFA